jgi:hypothetical protein
LLGVGCRANCRPQCATDNRTITTTDLVTDRRTGSAANATTDGGIQRGIIRVRIDRHERKEKVQVFEFDRSHKALGKVMEVRKLLSVAR